MGIKSFHFIDDVLKQIIQQNIGSIQALLETQMEQSVIDIHLIIAFRIFFPYAFCFCGMESGRVLLKEALRICHLQNTIIKVLKRRIPCTGSPLFKALMEMGFTLNIPCHIM